MNSSEKQIFVSPYRMQVLNALKQSAQTVLDQNLPSLKKAIEVGCGTGFFYRYMASEELKKCLTGYDTDDRALAFFTQESPSARIKLGSVSKLDCADSSVDVVVGFSAYPLLTQNGVIGELSRVLRPGGRIIAFQDSLIIGPWEIKQFMKKCKEWREHIDYSSRIFPKMAGIL